MDHDFHQHLRELEAEHGRQELERQVKPGEQRLQMVGLTLDDLAKQKAVLDLGAEDGYIARAAHVKGLSTRVISIDIEPPPKQLVEAGLPFYQFDLTKEREWPPKEALGSPTLAITKQGPLFTSRDEVAAKGFLDSVFRRLAQNGQIRIYPTRFGFIQDRLFGDDAKYSTLKSKPLAELLQDPQNNEFNLKANEATKAWLGANKFKFSVGRIENFEGPSANGEFLILEQNAD